MKKLIMPAVALFVPLIIIAGFVLLIWSSPAELHGDYHVESEVGNSEEIETAVSNVVSDLRRRDFVPVYLEVKWHPARERYVVYAKGIDRGNLLKRNP